MKPSLVRLVVVVVAFGAAFAGGFALGGRLDPLGWLLLGLIVGLGLLGVAVARRGQRGDVSPRQCATCGGLLSAHAPYCKHCGAPVVEVSQT